MSKKYIFKEFISFLRFENSLFTSGIALSGYLIFNQISLWIAPLFLAMFFGTSASYSYNYLKDKREDLVNKKILNEFVMEESWGKSTTMFLYGASFISAIFLSLPSFTTYMILVLLSILYSGGIRLKEKFLLKNLNTGFTMSLAFIMGATASGVVGITMIPYAVIVMVLGFAANVLGDIRGYEGDKSIGMHTLPILIGPEKTKVLLYMIISLLSISVLFLKYIVFYPLVPFMVVAMILLSRDKMKGMRISLLSSFALLPLFIIVLNIIGGF